MHSLYSLSIKLFDLLLPLLGFFSTKLEEFRTGRKTVFERLAKHISGNEQFIWFHAASLGEYEQGVPVMEEIRKQYPEHKILLTFFSPSGYTIKKNTELADLTVYLPLDTPENAKRFIDLIRPALAVFIKYEFWPNYLKVLEEKRIPTILISGVFRESQPFFKFYGSWMTRRLGAFEHFFVQDQQSADNLKKLGIERFTLSGDTRFDRVSRQLEYDNKLPFLEEFAGESPVLVCGSTWTEDEELLLDFINGSEGLKIVIAPHQIEDQKIKNQQQKISKRVLRFTEKKGKNLEEYDVLILDTVGLLSKAYWYASVAYVGGAVGVTGLHNILEPATFGVPVVCGKNIQKFPEAIRLRKLAGLYTVDSSAEAKKLLNRFFEDSSFREKTGMIAGHFVNSNTGATSKILNYLKENHTLTA